jgi:hypothetical protein
LKGCGTREKRERERKRKRKRKKQVLIIGKALKHLMVPNQPKQGLSFTRLTSS